MHKKTLRFMLATGLTASLMLGAGAALGGAHGGAAGHAGGVDLEGVRGREEEGSGDDLVQTQGSLHVANLDKFSLSFEIFDGKFACLNVCIGVIGLRGSIASPNEPHRMHHSYYVQ